LTELNTAHPKPIEREGSSVSKDSTCTQSQSQCESDPSPRIAVTTNLTDRYPKATIPQDSSEIPVTTQETTILFYSDVLARAECWKKRMIEGTSRNSER
tara:strand:+ start:96 stop:392 length:297 start_codon:yes stop_codon:yes gene_type:complete